MKKGIKITLWITGILAAVLLGAFAFIYFDTKRALRVVIPEFERIEDTRLTLAGDTAFINASLKFKNRSFLELNIDSFIYKVTLDTMLILSKAQDLDARLEPSQEDTIHLPLSLPYRSLMKEVQRLSSHDSTKITFDLRLVYATWLGRMTLPYKKTVYIEIPVPPELELEKLEYKGREGSQLHFDAHLQLSNKGNLDLSLSSLSYELDVKDHFKVSGEEQGRIVLEPFSTKNIVLPVSVTFDNLFRTLIRIATNKDKVHYHLKVKAFFRTSKLKSEKSQIFIDRSGVTELKK